MQGHRCSPLCPLVATGKDFSKLKATCIEQQAKHQRHLLASLFSRENPCVEERHPYQKQPPPREAAALESYAGQQCGHFKVQCRTAGILTN